MADTETVALITGGALVLSQAFNIGFNLWSQNQKNTFEIKRASLLKKIEIGENFFHTVRESMLNINKQIEIGKVKNDINSDITREYLNYQNDQIKVSIEKLIAESSKFNLAELYFNIESTTSTLINDLSTIISTNVFLLESEYNLQFITSEGLNRGLDQHNEIYNNHQVFLRNVLARQGRDLQIVKNEILKLSLLVK
ncbi:MAG: hypothetical protein JWQ06_2373 [Mucilaginibacter sp.]|nr:hypothetical protein [Mucilaginibacter sp.]